MSLAFAAVITFLLFAPGVILRRSYFSYPFSKRFSGASAADEVVWAIIPAVGLHLVGVAIVRALGYSVDLTVLGHLVLGAKEDAVLEATFKNLNDNLWSIALYNVSLWVASAALGHGARRFVLGRELDRRYRLLRFSNDWYYLLTGRRWGLEEGRDFDVVWLDALVGSGAESSLYSGILDEYYPSREEGLESLCLREVTKWVVAEGSSKDEPQKERAPKYQYVASRIPGKVLVLKYRDVMNLNITFYSYSIQRAVADDVGVSDSVQMEVVTPGGTPR